MLSKPSNVSASNPPPPDVASFAGAHCVPFHFKTCPDVGAVVVVSTSDNTSIEKLLTATKASPAPLTLRNPFSKPEKVVGVSVSAKKVLAPPPPPPASIVPGFHLLVPWSQTSACPFVGAAVEVSTSDKMSMDLFSSASLTHAPA